MNTPRREHCLTSCNSSSAVHRAQAGLPFLCSPQLASSQRQEGHAVSPRLPRHASSPKGLRRGSCAALTPVYAALRGTGKGLRDALDARGLWPTMSAELRCASCLQRTWGGTGRHTRAQGHAGRARRRRRQAQAGLLGPVPSRRERVFILLVLGVKCYVAARIAKHQRRAVYLASGLILGRSPAGDSLCDSRRSRFT